MREYNIFAKLKDSIQQFDTEKITIAGKSQDFSLGKKTAGYQFSQRDTLDLIDLYYNSKFEKGLYDSEGQRKAFLNISKFRADVAAKQTDIDVKDYVFIPEEGSENMWKAFLMQRKFAVWARENYYGELINSLNKDYSKYGTAVLKSVGKEVKRVPIRTLRNSQDAESLQDAVECGGYVIEEHEMTRFEMNEYKDWDVTPFKYDEKYKIFELYTQVPLGFIKEVNDQGSTDADWEQWVMAVAVLCPEKKDSSYDTKGHILFIEKISKVPYEEVHWDKQDGRWLGLGEVENQFENQIARNFTANLRRRALLWGSKKIFQSPDEMVGKNLVKDVKDGEILQITQGGQITQVGMESRNLAEFGADEEIWEKNSDQKAFTYEVVTGETMPSGTPFRLGVILSNSAAQHFALKREQFGLFLERSFFNQIIPIFKKQTKEHTLTVAANSVGAEVLKEAMIEYHANKRVVNGFLNRKPLSYKTAEQLVRTELEKKPNLFVNIDDGFYDDAKFYLSLQITGESANVQQEIESLTTLLQLRLQNPQGFEDPENRKLANLIMSKTGKNSDAILGKPEASPLIPSPQGLAGNTQPNAGITQPAGAGNVPSPVGNQ